MAKENDEERKEKKKKEQLKKKEEQLKKKQEQIKKKEAKQRERDISLSRNKKLLLEMKEFRSTEIPPEIPANEDLEDISYSVYEGIPIDDDDNFDDLVTSVNSISNGSYSTRPTTGQKCPRQQFRCTTADAQQSRQSCMECKTKDEELKEARTKIAALEQELQKIKGSWF